MENGKLITKLINGEFDRDHRRQGNSGLDGIEDEGNNELGQEHRSWVCRFRLARVTG